VAYRGGSRIARLLSPGEQSGSHQRLTRYQHPPLDLPRQEFNTLDAILDISSDLEVDDASSSPSSLTLSVSAHPDLQPALRRKISEPARNDSRDYTSSSKSTKDFVWRPAAAVTSAGWTARSRRLFVSAHRVLTLQRAATVGVAAIIYRQPRVIYAPAEWAEPYRRKTRLIKYRAICHGSLWCDRERIILWISSSARLLPHLGPRRFSPLRASRPLSFWERITSDRPPSLSRSSLGASECAHERSAINRTWCHFRNRNDALQERFARYASITNGFDCNVPGYGL
jgi:hypothetical protein